MKNLRPRAERDFAWSDGSRSRERFGFKFGLHVISYFCRGGILEVGRKLARECGLPISYDSVDSGVASEGRLEL